MKPHSDFVTQQQRFWAYVRLISEQTGYTETRKGPNKGKIKIPNIHDIKKALVDRNLNFSDVLNNEDEPTEFGESLVQYFEYRADSLNNYVKPRLMDAERAKDEFDGLKDKLKPTCPLPLNKQKGEKKAPAYLTGIINMLVEANAEGLPCNYDPLRLTTFSKNSTPLRTLSRRVDGAFTGTENPIAIWEIKEYYYTTTFGSRVADGVYESLLDGMELRELWQSHKRKVYHYMMVDAYYCWWVLGKSYLCRLIDMLNMGYVDEVLFGYEVIERLPSLVKGWVKISNTSSH